MSEQLAGKTVFIAGASSGMGRAIAIMAASQGAKLILLARDSARLAKTAADAGGDATLIVGDASDAVSLADILAPHAHAIDDVDMLINSVGMNIVERAFGDLTDQSWSAMLDVNLTAAFNLTKAVIPGMRRRGRGLIIHIASTAARKADLSGAAYQATKAGVVALNHAVMEEEWQNGIRMTAIMPGMTDTPLLDRRPAPVSPESRAAALQPEDIAAACLFVMQLPPRAHVAEMIIQPARR